MIRTFKGLIIAVLCHFGIMETMEPQSFTRLHSSSVFSQSNDGTIRVVQPIKLGGVQLSAGVSFTPGVRVGDTEMGALIGKDLEAERKDGVYIIKAYYE